MEEIELIKLKKFTVRVVPQDRVGEVLTESDKDMDSRVTKAVREAIKKSIKQ